MGDPTAKERIDAFRATLRCDADAWQHLLNIDAMTARLAEVEAERDLERRERSALGAYAMGEVDSDHERWAKPWGPPLWAYMQWGRAEADRLFPDGWGPDAPAELIIPTLGRLDAAEARAGRLELQASMACEQPCGDCAGCLTAHEHHTKDNQHG